MTARVRPPRTAAHADRDALIQQFADAGLVPVLSTNGSTPDADIQNGKVPLWDGGKPGDVVGAWLTENGRRRLLVAAQDKALGLIGQRRG